MEPTPKSLRHAEDVFRERGGTLRTTQLVREGVQYRTLYWMRDHSMVVELDRGLYRLADLPELATPDLVIVAARVPEAVVCLISALDFHDLTTQIPHEVDIALPRGAWRPAIDYPPVRVYRFSEPAFVAGVVTHELDGVPVRVYEPAKTVADCFKFRNKVGLDVAVEALRECLSDRRATPDEILEYARVCRVEGVVRPYLEALTLTGLAY